MKKKLITLNILAISLMSTNVFAAVSENEINQAYTTPYANLANSTQSRGIMW